MTPAEAPAILRAVTDDLITTRAAAALLGVGTTSIKRWSDDGTLRCIKTAGGHRRFIRADVAALLTSGLVEAADEEETVSAAELVRGRLPAMSEEQLDALPFGVVQLDDAGCVLAYNAYEERFAGKRRADVLGRSFFTMVAPCTNNRLLHGRFRQGIAAGALDLRTHYTFTYAMAARVVLLDLFRDGASGTNWLLVQPA